MTDTEELVQGQAQDQSQQQDDHQTVKFYQTGTFTVGNRLLDDEFRTVQATQERSNSIDSGHRACQGCGQALGARYALDTAMRVTNNKIIAANATGCLEVFTTPYPETAWSIPWIHSLFGNAAAVASGIAASLEAKGDTVTRVIAQGGDGGTTDIGFGSLSGMFDRNDDVLYICYDNGGYMNTGVQRSSATPGGARTSTTMPVGDHPGSSFNTGKFMPLIAMGHEIPYVATASVHDLHDLERKVEKAMSFRGSRYLQINVPCPLGWGSEPSQTIKLARMGVESGLVPLFEAEYGQLTNSTKIRYQIPVEEYLKSQRRFAHILKPANVDQLDTIRALAERNIRRYQLV